MLAIYTGKGVAPEVNLNEQKSHKGQIRLPTPQGDITEVWNRAISLPENGYVYTKKFFRKSQLV